MSAHEAIALIVGGRRAFGVEIDENIDFQKKGVLVNTDSV